MAIQLAEMTKCKNCNCECHCKDILHTPSHQLDGGGLCICDNCDCVKSVDKTFENESRYDLDEEAFNGA